MSPQSPSPRRRGFTLVEMLVVIVIILILIALLVPAVAGVLAKAHETAILSEEQQLDASLKAFKEKYSSYPPSDFTSLVVSNKLNMNCTVAIFMGKAFPRCNVQNELSAIVALEGGSTAVPFSPAQALVFWLSGFSGDPEHPITGRLPAQYGGLLANGAVSWPFFYSANPPDARFSFDQGRLVVIQYVGSQGQQVPPGTGVPALGVGAQSNYETVPVFIPSTSHTSPYVYFAAQDYTTHWQANYQFPTGGSGSFAGVWAGQGGAGAVRPYLQDTNAIANNQIVLNAPYFVNPNSFQIISAGLDDDYGGGACIFSTGGPSSGQSVVVQSANTAITQLFTTTQPVGYFPGDKDNLTNFSPGELSAAVPQP